MRKAENKNAPMLSGWVIAGAAGLVAFGVLVAVGQFELFPAAAIGGVVALIVGVILGLPWGAEAGATKASVKAPVKAVDKVAEAPVKAPEAKPALTAPLPAAALAPMAAVKSAPEKAPEPAPAAAAVMAPVMADATAKPKAEKAADKPAQAAGPERLTAARSGNADDLKEIEGIGPAMEKLVNSLGFYHFDQIAKWSEADVAVVDSEMKSFKGRITRDKWVAQAKIIVTEGLEVFRERAKTNNY